MQWFELQTLRKRALYSKLRMCQLSKAEACAFYEVHQSKPFFEKLTDFMSSGKMVAMELVATNAIGKWRNLIGPTDSETARSEAPASLRAQFGTDNTKNACHGSDAPDTAAAVSAFCLVLARAATAEIWALQWAVILSSGQSVVLCFFSLHTAWVFVTLEHLVSVPCAQLVTIAVHDMWSGHELRCDCAACAAQFL